MEVLEHGMYYNTGNEETCSCGCKFRYEISDILIDDTLTLTSYPPQYNQYVRCPECAAKILLSTTYRSGPIQKI